MVCGIMRGNTVSGPLRFIDFDTVTIFIKGKEVNIQKGVVLGTQSYMTQDIVAKRYYSNEEGHLGGDKYALLLTIMDATSPDFNRLHCKIDNSEEEVVIEKSILDNSTELAKTADDWVKMHVYPRLCFHKLLVGVY